MHPAVVYPVRSDMRLWHEEQFGPIVGVATFENSREVLDYMADSPYGQQASIFGTNLDEVDSLANKMTSLVSRVNINTQCQRGPDILPFTGRRDSAQGTLSIDDALEAFSVKTVIARR
jgi:acyl-CoA reductase-like NAD-dependent aldehyde dehydrogenase